MYKTYMKTRDDVRVENDSPTKAFEPLAALLKVSTF
jgi:hypothetical protein